MRVRSEKCEGRKLSDKQKKQKNWREILAYQRESVRMW